MEEFEDREEPVDLPPSRSARKRDAKGVELLAQKLVELPDADFVRLPATADIITELTKARATKGHGARKRQLKFVAGLLRRDLEGTEELRAFVAGEHQQQLDDNRLVHRLENLRERLCDPHTRSAALHEARDSFAGLDVIELQRLVASYKGPADKKNYRQIFRCLRAGSDASEPINQ
ncbi:MAG: ribosome biogenesis factor YjgA [Desulfuromonas sp.]|nr:ribosome biogenesis factor YjgA [Desulfuromonas sp.]